MMPCTLRSACRWTVTLSLLLLATLSVAPAGRTEPGAAEPVQRELTIYSGRGESLVAPLVESFESETGIRVNVRYAGTAELAVLLFEEGSRTPADLFWAQDAGALGALAGEGLLAGLPTRLYDELPDIYRSTTGRWLATSGRARVLAYSSERVDEAAFPESVFDLAAPEYRGRVGWAPTNGSFQAFVTAMRIVHGEEATADWLRAMQTNDVQPYRNNTTQLEAIAAGEIDFALVNNYYLLRFTASDPDYPVAQRFLADGDIGNMVNIAGIGVLASSRRTDEALAFAEFLLSHESQAYFTGTVYEYPVIADVEPDERLESFQTLLDASPRVDLDALQDLEGTLSLLRETGLL